MEIGATETALHYFLLPSIEHFRNSHPKVYIHVGGSSTQETLLMLRDEKVDLVVSVSPVSNTDGLEVVQLSTFSDIFVVGPQHADLCDRSLSAQEICEYPIATIEKGTSAREHIDYWFAIGIIPSMFASEAIEQKKLFMLNSAIPIPPRHILMIYRSDSHMSKLCRESINYLSNESKDANTVL